MTIDEFTNRLTDCIIREEFDQTRGQVIVYSGSMVKKLYDELTNPALRPMEDAPRDGTEILLYTVKSMSPMIGCWQTQKEIEGWVGDDVFYDRESGSCYMQITDELRSRLPLPEVQAALGEKEDTSRMTVPECPKVECPEVEWHSTGARYDTVASVNGIKIGEVWTEMLDDPDGSNELYHGIFLGANVHHGGYNGSTESVETAWKSFWTKIHKQGE